MFVDAPGAPVPVAVVEAPFAVVVASVLSVLVEVESCLFWEVETKVGEAVFDTVVRSRVFEEGEVAAPDPPAKLES